MTEVLPTRRLRWILTLTSTAFFMTCLDTLVVATALPRIQESLHVGLAGLQWTVNAYNIALAAGIICAAALGDRFGRRRLFVAGTSLFTVASIVCALASSGSVLIAARTVQGLGGAVILPLSLTILTAAFPAERRASVLGVYGGLAGLAVALGPIVGGAITEGASWHWIFWLNVPIGVAAIPLSLRYLPESYGPKTPLDPIGVALCTVALVGLACGLVRGNDIGWGSREVAAAIVVGALALVAFVAWEAWTAHPMLSLSLLRIPAFAAGNAASLLTMAAISSGAFLVTQFFQIVMGYSPLEAGVRLLPFFATPMVIAPAAGKLSERVGLRPLIVLGQLMLGAGFLWVALVATTAPSYLSLVVALAVAGVGVSMTIPTTPTAVFGAVAPEQLGRASGMNSMLQRIGAVLGVAIASSVFSAYGKLGSPETFTTGFRPAVAVAAALAFAGAAAGLGVLARTSDPRSAAPEPEVVKAVAA